MDIVGGKVAASATVTVTKLALSGNTVGGILTMTTGLLASAQVCSVIISPTTGTTQYKLGVKENATGYYFVKSGMTWTGTQIILTNFPIVNSTVKLEITSASADEAFTAEVRYL